MEDVLVYLKALMLNYGVNIILAILILLVGKWLARKIQKIFVKLLKNAKFEDTIITFLSNIFHALLLIFIVLVAMNQLGIETTSFIAILGAAGLAVGFALKDSLSNFASGVMLLIFKQIKIGDFVEIAGVSGSVNDVNIFFTKLSTPDNRVIYVPNSNILSSNIINFSENNIRRIDLLFGIGYSDDIDKSKKIILEILANDSRVLTEPKPQVVMAALADSSVNFHVRPWVNKEDYWAVYSDITELVKKRFDEEQISIPFPQRDVHIFQ